MDLKRWWHHEDFMCFDSIGTNSWHVYSNVMQYSDNYRNILSVLNLIWVYWLLIDRLLYTTRNKPVKADDAASNTKTKYNSPVFGSKSSSFSTVKRTIRGLKTKWVILAFAQWVIQDQKIKTINGWEHLHQGLLHVCWFQSFRSFRKGGSTLWKMGLILSGFILQTVLV